MKTPIYHTLHVTWTQHSPEPQLMWMNMIKTTPSQQAMVWPSGWQRLWCPVQFVTSYAVSEIMKVTDSSVIRFHLQVLHGITVGRFEVKRDRLFIGTAKVFGVPLENLPRRYIPEFGLVPWWVMRVGVGGWWDQGVCGGTWDSSSVIPVSHVVFQLSGGRLSISSGACWNCRPVQETRLSSSHQDSQGKKRVWQALLEH